MSPFPSSTRTYGVLSPRRIGVQKVPSLIKLQGCRNSNLIKVFRLFLNLKHVITSGGYPWLVETTQTWVSFLGFYVFHVTPSSVDENTTTRLVLPDSGECAQEMDDWVDRRTRRIPQGRGIRGQSGKTLKRVREPGPRTDRYFFLRSWTSDSLSRFHHPDGVHRGYQGPVLGQTTGRRKTW